MAYASWSVVFGEQPSAAKWNILGTNDAYFDGLVGSGTAWSSWTPTWTNFTIGTGTNDCKYQQFGKTVFFRLLTTLGGTSSMGTAPTFTLPVTSIAVPDTVFPIAWGAIYNGSGTYSAYSNWSTTTTALLRYYDTNSNGAGVTSTTPGTWASGYKILMTGVYQAA